MNSNAVVTIVVCLAVFLVGFALGRVTATMSVVPIPETASDAVMEMTSTQSEDTSDATVDVQDGATVSKSNLTDGQRKLIEAFGIDADSITITPEMIACAEAKLGAARIEEIKNGATPSFSEGITLAGCYRP